MSAGRSEPGRHRASVVLALVAVAAPALALVVGEARVGRALERRLYDGWFTLRGPLPRPDGVVVVAIDLASEESLGRYPWSRDWHARLIDNLHRAGARVVAFDATFADGFPAEDTLLRRAIDEAGNVVLGAKTAIVVNRNAVGSRLEEPAGVLRGATIGIVDVQLDGADGIVREYPVLHDYPQGSVPQLGLQAVLLASGLSPDDLEAVDGGWRLGDRFLPRGPGGGMLIDFVGPFGSVSTYSYASVVDDAATDLGDWDMDAFEDLMSEGRFRDRIVVVGSTVPEHQDLHPTPFRDVAGAAGATLTPGVEIHANAIATVLGGVPRRALPRPLQYAWTFLLGILVVAISFRMRGARGAAATLAVAALGLAAAWWAFEGAGVWLWSAAPVLAVGLCYAGASAGLYMLEEEEKARIRGMFSQYVAASVVDELIRRPELLSLGGEERTLSVLFSDVADFSGISERLTPTELVALLNEYLTHMSEIVLLHGGIVDKYQGDCIMAEFGAPIPLEDHALRACRAAVEMKRELAALRAKWAGEGRPQLRARIGINTGTMLVGNLGSRRIMDYTVMGDQVNLASRLEGANKLYGTGILVAEATWTEVRKEMVGRELDRIRVKGKAEPVTIYEVLGPRDGSLPPGTEELVADFEAALALYGARRFAEALAAFDALLAAHPGDGPSLLYRERSGRYRSEPPPEDWDGVYTMTTK